MIGILDVSGKDKGSWCPNVQKNVSSLRIIVCKPGTNDTSPRRTFILIRSRSFLIREDIATTSGTSCGVCRACCLSKPSPPDPSNHLQLAMAGSRLAPCVLWMVARRKGCQPLLKCFPLYLQPSDLFPHATSRECPPVSPTRCEDWKSQGARTWLVSIDQPAFFYQDHPFN